MPRQTLILVQSAEVARQLRLGNERRMRFGDVEFFGPYNRLKLAPVRARFRAAAAKNGYGGAIRFFDVEIEVVEMAEEIATL